MERLLTQIHVQQAEGDAEKPNPRYTFQFAGHKINRNGWRLNFDGMDTAGFQANPVVLLNHDADALPIGRAVSLTKKARSLSGTIEFGPEDELAQRVKGKVDRGYINAVSVSYVPLETEFIDADSYDDKWEMMWNADLDILRSDLVEVSIVGIPADSSAVRKQSFQTDMQELLSGLNESLKQE